MADLTPIFSELLESRGAVDTSGKENGGPELRPVDEFLKEAHRIVRGLNPIIYIQITTPVFQVETKKIRRYLTRSCAWASSTLLEFTHILSTRVLEINSSTLPYHHTRPASFPQTRSPCPVRPALLEFPTTTPPNRPGSRLN